MKAISILVDGHGNDGIGVEEVKLPNPMRIPLAWGTIILVNLLNGDFNVPDMMLP